MGATPAMKSQEVDELESALEDSQVKEEGKEEGEEAEVETEEAKEATVYPEDKIVEPPDFAASTDETEKETKAEEAAKEPTDVEKLTGEVKDLKQMLRTSKREQVQMEAKLERLSKRPVSAPTEDEEEDEGEAGTKPAEEPLSRVEEIQGAIGQIASERGASLNILLETMEQGAYKDIRDVCSRGNFDDIFEAIATEASKESGKDFNETLLEVELSVWAKDNPYKYMYELVKKHHPSYVKKEEIAKPAIETEKKPADAPSTIADKGGDSGVKAGWTSNRINEMPEDELSTVPEDVYDKYLIGILD